MLRVFKPSISGLNAIIDGRKKSFKDLRLTLKLKNKLCLCEIEKYTVLKKTLKT